ncbi:uncharacterized protein LOC106136449 [Amyelois transitella]|uniref:uncharacterized protein LOC106136449 n=1 Tax=Amyelois transitella TaxID=680683 RepID=UPI0029903681|nr:uncharacterized protein LOC106136449 [Amyelois transitella]
MQIVKVIKGNGISKTNFSSFGQYYNDYTIMDTVKVRGLLADIANEQNYEDYSIEITPISSGGANYTSVLFTAKISAPNKQDLELFGKVASINAQMREETPILFYDIERFAYTELAKIYENIERKHGIPKEDRLVLSKYYGSSAVTYEETIVFENLSAKGFTVHDRMKSVDWQYASKAIEVLAKFHALSMCYAEEYPESFKKHQNKFSLDSMCTAYSKGLEMFLPFSTAVVKDENKERYKRFFDNVDLKQLFQPVGKPVFVHGDYRPSNLMHRNNEDSSLDLIPVDLQTLLPGSGVLDLFYFIFTATDGAFRKQYYNNLIDHYYATLSRMLRAYGLNPDKAYSREDFDNELKERIHFGLVATALTLPLVTVEAEDAPDAADPSFNDLQMKTGKTLPERLNDIVDEFVLRDLL